MASKNHFGYCALFLDAEQRRLWLPGLLAAVEATDLEVLVFDVGQVPVVADPRRTILAICEAEALQGMAVDHFSLVLSGLSQITRPVNASNLAAYGSFLPGTPTWVYTEKDARSGVGQFVFFGELPVHVPAQVLNAAEDGSGEVERSLMSVFVDGTSADVGTRLIWPASVFTYGKGGKEDLPQRMDLTGVPRLLVSGPHLFLPKGRWGTTCRFDIDAEAAGSRMVIEWGGLETFTLTDVRFEKQGVYEFQTEVDVEALSFVELRVSMKASALAGTFEFLGAEVCRL